MDFMTIVGIVIGLLAILGGFLLEDGHLSGLLVYTAALIVFGGTIGAVIVSFPRKQLAQLPRALKVAFRERQTDSMRTVEDMVDMAATARKEGVLALEDRVLAHEHPFLRTGMQMVIDGADTAWVQKRLDLEIDAQQRRYAGYAKLFETAGGFAPTMGIIGTVMGLIHVLGGMEDPTSLAGAIAVAFTATLYGVGSANLIYLPIANKIHARCEQHVTEMEMMLEGMLAIQAGEHPQLIRSKLMTYIETTDSELETTRWEGLD